MNQFLGTLILVLVSSFILFCMAEIKDSGKPRRTHSTIDNMWIPVVICSVVAILIWLLKFAFQLLS